MKIGDLVKYVPSIPGGDDNEVGLIVAIVGQWFSVLWMGDTSTHGYTADSLEVINENR